MSGGAHGPEREVSVTSTQWPSMLPEGTPGTPIRDRKRKRKRERGGLISSLLARLWPPAGSHHAVPGTPQEDPPPPPAPSRDDGSCSQGAVTLTDFTAFRMPGRAREPQGRHRA